MKKQILIIEDTIDVRENISEILILCGYDVLMAENGKIGAEMAIEHVPDLIVCDVMMPELDGYGVHHIILRNHRTAHIPFIYLTARDEPDSIRRGMSLGADDYLSKPFNANQLLQTIEARLLKTEKIRATAELTPRGTLELLLDEAKAFSQLRCLANDREIRQVMKKQEIYRVGEVPRWLYYIEKGQVKIIRSAEDGRSVIVKIAKAGDFLGFLAILKENSYTETAQALDDCEVSLIPQKEFLKLLYFDPNIAAAFMKLLAGQISLREQALLDMAYASVRRKVANALVYLYENDLNPIHLMRDDLAALAGIAKETAIRTLTDFKHEGMIQITEGGAIHIMQIDKIRALPN